MRLFHSDALIRAHAGGTAGTRFTADGYFPLPGFLTPHGLDTLRAEAMRLEQLARRRDFAMDCMEGSPRHMTTLGGHIIAQESQPIPLLYQNQELLQLIGTAVGRARRRPGPRRAACAEHPAPPRRHP
ncbi:hypothetical protein [Streptomyces sp. NPDC127190]|uniref:HalD/BesD family halogenase n=1 Tax=unclassified Streptomyces TaxID=2593676 RepID=UPI00362A5990